MCLLCKLKMNSKMIVSYYKFYSLMTYKLSCFESQFSEEMNLVKEWPATFVFQ